MQNAGSSSAMEPAYKTTGSYKPEVRNIDIRRGRDLKSTWRKEHGGFYVWVSVHHNLIYMKNQRDATWQYVY